MFAEYGEAGSRVGTTYLRKTDGSPPIRLGSGLLGALSPDGKWVATVQGGRGLMLLPAGAGQEKTLDAQRFESISRIAWFSNGRRLLLAARESGGQDRLYIQSIDSSEAKPVTQTCRSCTSSMA